MQLIEDNYKEVKSKSYGRILIFHMRMETYQDNRYRNIRVWLPDEYDGQKKFPVIYMHDAQNLFDDAQKRFKWFVDREMYDMKKDNVSAIIVGIDNASTRMSELCPDILPINEKCYEACKLPLDIINPTGNLYAEFIVKQLKPWIDRKFCTLADKKNTTIGGSSMGGLISFYMLLEYSEIFGNAMVFSPNFVMYKKHDFLHFLKQVDIKKLDGNRIFIFHGGLGLEKTNWPYVKGAFEIMRKKGLDEDHLVLIYDSRQPHFESAWRKYYKEAIIFLTKNREENC